MNNVLGNFMNKKLNATVSTVVLFALLLTAIVMPTTTVVAETVPSQTTTAGFDFSLPGFGDLFGGDVDFDTTESGTVVTESNSSFTECVLEASRELVNIGESINLSWYTSGFDTITVNGQVVTNTSGSMTISNLQNTTVFTLKAINDSGSSCTQTVTVTCLPPVDLNCELEVLKRVNATTAVPGVDLTYTITVKNIGDGDCTGGGVKIDDVLDPNINYQSHQVSSNFSAGYAGTPVYTSSDRTLHFNGNVLTPGESGTITWVGKVNTPTQCGDFEVKNQAKATAAELNNFGTWVYSPVVKTIINNDCPTPEPCELELHKSVNKTAANVNDELTYTITIKNTGDETCTGSGVKIEDVLDPNITYLRNTVSSNLGAGYLDIPVYTSSDRTLHFNGFDLTPNESGTITWVGKVTAPTQCGDFVVKNQAKTTAAELNNYQTWVYSEQVQTDIDNNCDVPVPKCDRFTANPSTILAGASTTLSWETTNATQAFINNGVGVVAQDGSVVVSPLASIVYQLKIIDAEEHTVTCTVPVTVTEDIKPVCESFTATPASLPVGGGSVALNWKVTNAVNASISPQVGSVALIGSQSVPVTQSTSFTLTAVDGDGDEVSCTAPVTVADPQPVLSCANNVTFTASDRSIDRGDKTTLTWSTTGVDSLTISGINATTLSGSQSVSPTSDITYTLTAKRGSESVNCPLSIDVSSGGGGGGSSSPRCELTISDSKIRSGEKVVLRWDTANATEVTLSDDRGKVLMTTDDYMSKDKDEHYDGKLTVTPTRDTTYTLLAERGSRDKECDVKVDVSDDVVVLESRDQQPLIAGISLSQVPYTGFEAGTFMTILFYALLVAWSLLITYLLINRRQTVGGSSSAINEPLITITQNVAAMRQAEAIRPDLFAATVVAPRAQNKLESAAPLNLPTQPIIGYENVRTEPKETVNPHQVNDEVVTELENRAHSQKALLSSDAIRHFIGTTDGSVNRHETLDAIIAEAKKNYPLEDGWVVINESRMYNLCDVCKEHQLASSMKPFIPATVPEGSGSLAEAIVTGNVVAAYAMIGNRPMFALADAAADFDAVYRNRRGGDKKVSDLLIEETKNLSDEKLKNIIAALTGALDGTYNDEASAVKMAIMKAVKEAA
jgi:uncharacterized repeat protein (TIGR01451 family)